MYLLRICFLCVLLSSSPDVVLNGAPRISLLLLMIMGTKPSWPMAVGAPSQWSVASCIVTVRSRICSKVVLGTAGVNNRRLHVHRPEARRVPRNDPRAKDVAIDDVTLNATNCPFALQSVCFIRAESILAFHDRDTCFFSSSLFFSTCLFLEIMCFATPPVHRSTDV